MLAERHEQKLGEIKALTHELGQSIQEVLGCIKEAQDQLAAQDRRNASSGVEGGAAGSLIAFVHIPKTAGGTVTTMLARAYSNAGLNDAGNYIRGPETTARRVARRPGGWERWHRGGGRVTIGHVPYGLFRKHLPADTRYMTFLREPVDRVLSHYYRHVHHPEMSRADRIKLYEKEGRARAGSLEEALVEMRVAVLSNLETRFLCGYPSPMGELPASALDDAKANLREFAFVGIQERFEESLVLLQRTLGLGLLPYWNVHVSMDRPNVEQIPDQERVLIEEYNRLDAELYSFALQLFEDALTASDKGLAADANRLRVLSTEANEKAIQEARDWLEREVPVGGVKLTRELRLAGKAAGIPGPALMSARTRVERARRHRD